MLMISNYFSDFKIIAKISTVEHKLGNLQDIFVYFINHISPIDCRI